ILQGQFLPKTAYEVRGIFVGTQAAEWSGWLPVITPDARFGAFDLYDGVIGFEHLQADIAEYQSWIGAGVRDLIQEARNNALLTVSQDLHDYKQIKTARKEIRLTEDRVTAGYMQAITVAVGPDSAL